MSREVRSNIFRLGKFESVNVWEFESSQVWRLDSLKYRSFERLAVESLQARQFESLTAIMLRSCIVDDSAQFEFNFLNFQTISRSNV